MMKLIILICLIAGTCAQNCFKINKPINPKEKLSVPDVFKKYKVVDEYIPEAPKDLFTGGHNGTEIQCGAVISPMATLTPVHLSYPNGKEGVKYTALLLGIDYPEPGQGAYINAMFVNSPADDITKGDVIVPYTPAIPIPDSGVNRFVGLVYEQNDTLDANSVDLIVLARDRTGFSAADFARRFDLGKPVAGNVFLTSFPSCDSQ